jgi:predicted glycosyltransferase
MGRPRVLLYTHDGRGLGHLARLSRVAAVLQPDYSCLIVSGHKEVSWLTPGGCEFLRLPNFDSFLPGKAAYWGRTPFVDMDARAAREFRSQLLVTTVREFAPDVLIVDHRTGGSRGELTAALGESSARKYLLLRGVLNTEAWTATEVFTDAQLSLLKTRFSRILVACDPRICRVEDEHRRAASLRSMLYYVGYVAPAVSIEAQEEARRRRNIAHDTPWVVCSAGGGMESESLMDMCSRFGEKYPDIVLDIVRGPRAKAGSTDTIRDNGALRIWRECHELPLLHAAADVVICRGGYNSLMEAAAGGGQIICAPLNLGGDQEQLIHAQRLARWLPIHLSDGSPAHVSSLLRKILSTRLSRPAQSWAHQSGLMFEGARVIRSVLDNDLGVRDNADSYRYHT